MIAKINKLGNKIDFAFNNDGTPDVYEDGEISMIKFIHPLEDIRGLSPLIPAAFSVDILNNAKTWNNATFANHASPSGVMKVKGTIDKENHGRYKQKLKAFEGARNKGRTMILDEGADWQQMGMSAHEMDFINGQNLSAKQISLALGIPSVLLGDSDSSTYNNVKEAKRDFYTDTVIPIAKLIVNELNNWLMPSYGKNDKLAIVVESITALSEDKNDAATRSEKLFKAGIITRAMALSMNSLPFTDQDHIYMKFLNVEYVQAESKAESKSKNNIIEYNKTLLKDNIRKLDSLILKKKEKKLTKKKRFTISKIVSVLNALDGEEVHEDVKELYYTVIAEEGLRIFTDVLDVAIDNLNMDKYIEDYVEKSVLEKSILMTESTLSDKLKVQLEEGIKNKETLKELQARITKVFEDQYFISKVPNHVEMIARTEALTASSVGRNRAYVQSGVVVSTEWLTTLDGRERDSHGPMNNQIREVGKPFDTAGGNQLMFPRDPSGKAEEVIQCRCSEVPIVKGQKGEIIIMFDTKQKKDEAWQSNDDAAMEWVKPMLENYDKAWRRQLDNVLDAMDKAVE
jgi:HK97 family phage portal protein